MFEKRRPPMSATEDAYNYKWLKCTEQEDKITIYFYSYPLPQINMMRMFVILFPPSS